MRIIFSGSVFVLAMGLVVSMTTACPNEKSAAAKKGQSVSVAADKATAGYAKSAITVADKSKGCGPECIGNCEWCKKNVKTVADKAGPAKGGCSRPCSGKAATAASSEGCPVAKKIEALLASMPAMKYRVNGEVTGCSKSAESMAKKADKPIEFLVGEDVLTDRGEATARLTALLDKEAETLQSLQFVAGGKCHRCPMTAKSVAVSTKTALAYRVGGVDFKKKEDAEKALASVRDALASVRMEYKVDGKTYGCSKSAGAKCKEAGKKMRYVIGEDETGFQTTAKLKLAERKVRKIVETAVSASFSL